VEGQVSAGDPLLVDGAEVGAVTSLGRSPRSGVVALGWVRGAIEEGSAASTPRDGRVIVSSRVDEE
jgi:glycine cleavage system aminomethyltransferase T